MYPSAVVQADFRFFEGEGENVNGILIQGTGYGVPPTDPFGRTPNLAAPIETGGKRSEIADVRITISIGINVRSQAEPDPHLISIRKIVLVSKWIIDLRVGG